jgi:hypothetical protein
VAALRLGWGAVRAIAMLLGSERSVYFSASVSAGKAAPPNRAPGAAFHKHFQMLGW